MSRRLSIPAILLAATPLLADPAEFFESKVRPILAANCFGCHQANRMGGLAMTSADSLIKGGNSGPALIPRKPDDSLLIQAVTHTHAKLRMPPQGKLQSSDIEILRRWIQDGAIWPAAQPKQPQEKFWSFQPVKKPVIPQVKNPAWPKTPIDHFILARLESAGLAPSPAASKRILLRRIYLDLIGMPPSPEAVKAFEEDNSDQALAKVVDHLLASPAYGERWGRYWLDLARYTDDKLNIVADESYPNAYRYRDWVVKAFQNDLPYNQFIRAQIAADLLPAPEHDAMMPALGFYGMSAQYQEDRPDVTGKVFLGLTVGCAQCHDHKFDPIPTRDYYAMLGVFSSTRLKEYPLAPPDIVSDYEAKEKAAEAAKKKLDTFHQQQSRQLAEILASQIAEYVPAAWRVIGPEKLTTAVAAQNAALDQETVQRWVDYLSKPNFDHAFLNDWLDLRKANPTPTQIAAFAHRLQDTVVSIHQEITSIEDKNLATLGGAEGNPALAKIVLLPYPRDKYVFWSDLFGDSRTGFTSRKDVRVLLYPGPQINRFLSGQWKSYAEKLTAEAARLKAAVPEKFPFLHAIEESPEPKNLKIHIRGNPENLGDEAPRAFLSALCDGQPKPFQKGSGRLELADAIASPANPLTARVMVNRIWAHHFGAGIVRTPSNFGQLGDRPSHPELLDYLAARFIDSGWSIKAIHREILLSAAYALSAAPIEQNMRVDAANRLFWRANIRRLDFEALRDSMLAVSGALVPTTGGPPQPVDTATNTRRSLYSFVSRRKLDATLATFDFPNANDTSEQRIVTNTPIQRLYLLNSAFVMKQAENLAALAAQTANNTPEAVIQRAYQLTFGRNPDATELTWAKDFLASGEPLSRLTQALLASNEFIYTQ